MNSGVSAVGSMRERRVAGHAVAAHGVVGGGLRRRRRGGRAGLGHDAHGDDAAEQQRPDHQITAAPTRNVQ